MMLLVVSATLASLALGVTIAYGVCCALLAVFRMRIQAQALPRVALQAKIASL